jgi:hypothetical protein
LGNMGRREREKAPPPVVVAAPEPEKKPTPPGAEYYRICRAKRPYGSCWVVESVRIDGDRVVQGPETVTAADVYGLTEAKLMRMAKEPEDRR